MISTISPISAFLAKPLYSFAADKIPESLAKTNPQSDI
jgi:hypothetical protein